MQPFSCKRDTLYSFDVANLTWENSMRINSNDTGAIIDVGRIGSVLNSQPILNSKVYKQRTIIHI